MSDKETPSKAVREPNLDMDQDTLAIQAARRPGETPSETADRWRHTQEAMTALALGEEVQTYQIPGAHKVDTSSNDKSNMV